MEQIETSNFTSSTQLLISRVRMQCPKLNLQHAQFIVQLSKSITCISRHDRNKSYSGARKHYQLFQLNTFWGVKNFLAETVIAYLPYVPQMVGKNDCYSARLLGGHQRGVLGRCEKHLVSLWQAYHLGSHQCKYSPGGVWGWKPYGAWVWKGAKDGVHVVNAAQGQLKGSIWVRGLCYSTFPPCSMSAIYCLHM